MCSKALSEFDVARRRSSDTCRHIENHLEALGPSTANAICPTDVEVDCLSAIKIEAGLKTY
jgi:hypothetical protein